ncbi:MAG TPA: TonB-dependent receptor plug domain-containing protein [Longimicrobiales bacterium]|nr:TonB-dependent receptor plug domain-containing protein [Longimicrobiales bacterium]
MVRLAAWTWVGVAGLALQVPGALEARAEQERGALTGRVLTEEEGRPVAGVEVRLRDGPSVLTDRDGTYRIDEVPAGSVELAVVTSRCEVALGTARAGLDGDWVTNLSLPEEMAAAHRANRRDHRESLLLNAADLSQIPARTLADVLRREAPDMVIGLPGQPGRAARVQGRTRATATGATTPLFVLDGVRLGNDPSILWALTPEEVASVEILRGAVGGWSYGTDASGGAILIETRRGSDASATAPASCRVPAWPETGGRP